MVLVALGFVYNKNSQYVFQSFNVRDKVMTLLVCSLLALHPVCAAIQYLGIVEHDVQGDPLSSLSQSLLPTIALNRMFDFVKRVHSHLDEVQMVTQHFLANKILKETRIGAILP